MRIVFKLLAIVTFIIGILFLVQLKYYGVDMDGFDHLDSSKLRTKSPVYRSPIDNKTIQCFSFALLFILLSIASSCLSQLFTSNKKPAS